MVRNSMTFSSSTRYSGGPMMSTQSAYFASGNCARLAALDGRKVTPPMYNSGEWQVGSFFPAVGGVIVTSGL